MADACTTVNAQVGYRINRCQLRLFLNNVFDTEGYTAYYGGGSLNPTDPRNMAVAMTWQF